MRLLRTLLVACGFAVAIAATVDVHAQQQPQTYAQPARSTASWTSATAQDTRLSATITGFSSVTVALTATSPVTAGGLVFEGDDGTSTWWPVSCVRNGSPRAESTYAITATPQSWECDTAGWVSFGVRLNPAIAGAGTVTVSLTPTASPTEPGVVAAQLDPTQLQVTTQAAATDPLLRAVNALNASVRALALRVNPGGAAVPVYAMNAVDPCAGPKGNVPISQTASTRLVVGQAGKRVALCYARIVAGAAEIPSFTEGTGSACGTATLAVSGSTTAANGESYAANGGFSAGMGLGTVGTTAVTGNDLCLAQSTSSRLAGSITYVYY